jgi:hypothetical protein
MRPQSGTVPKKSGPNELLDWEVEAKTAAVWSILQTSGRDLEAAYLYPVSITR